MYWSQKSNLKKKGKKGKSESELTCLTSAIESHESHPREVVGKRKQYQR